MEKSKLFLKCINLLTEKIEGLQLQLDELQNSANQHTKSSAGDKYETGRAMAHQEQEKLQKNLDHHVHQRRLLRGLNHESKSIQAGALLKTNHGYFYLSVALGKIAMGKEFVFCISPQSPIAQAFLHWDGRTILSFNGKEFQLLSLQ